MSIFRKLRPPLSAGALAIATATAFFAPPVTAAYRKSAAAARVEVEPVPHLPNLEART